MPADEERQREAPLRFGGNLRAARERKGISQADLGREMAARGWPWHQSTVYKLEHGERRVDFHEAEDLAAILGVTTDRFTWLPAEANEAAFVREITAILRREGHEAANAVARLHAAISRGRRVLASSRDSKYQRVREACADLEAELKASTVEAVIAEGAYRYENPEDS